MSGHKLLLNSRLEMVKSEKDSLDQWNWVFNYLSIGLPSRRRVMSDIAKHCLGDGLGDLVVRINASCINF